MLFPGMMTRKTALRYAGRDAVQLLLGCIPLLVVAGIIEAFVSPTKLPASAKFTLSAALLATLIMWLSGNAGLLPFRSGAVIELRDEAKSGSAL